MDPITHAASGAVAMLALRRRPPRAVLAGALAAAAPDIDILFGNDPLTTLLLHRGITHALPAVPVFALLLALAALPLLRSGSSDRIYLSSSSPGRWSFPAVWLCMACMVLLHIWLDCVTTYGTLIFLPFSAERVRLNAVFIIDFLLTLPLLWTVWRCRASRRRSYQDKRSALAAARLALLWVFVYPLLGVGLNALHTSHVTDALRADTSRRDAVLEEVVVLPDAFAPFFWRVIWQERPVGVSPAGADALLRADLPDSGSVVRTAGLDPLGRLRTPFSEPRPAMPRDAAAALASRSVEAGAFFEFALLPVLDTVPDADRNEMLAPAVRQWRSYDLRFGSSLEFVRRIMSLRPNADIPFQFFFAVDADDQGAPRLDSVRLRFSDSRRDSGWRQPAEPRAVPLLRRLVGLR